MKSGFKILWTDQALWELEDTIKYLEENWTEKEIRNFTKELEHTIHLISRNPNLFPVSEHKKEVQKAVVARLNNLYYRQRKQSIEILSLFSNRQNPDKRI